MALCQQAMFLNPNGNGSNTQIQKGKYKALLAFHARPTSPLCHPPRRPHFYKCLRHQRAEDVSTPKICSENQSSSTICNEGEPSILKNVNPSLMGHSSMVDSTEKGLEAIGHKVSVLKEEDENLSKDLSSSLSIVVGGATGELARNKIFPAMFALFYNGCLPKNVLFFGYSRSKLSTEDFRVIISESVTCRVDHEKDCVGKLQEFLGRVFYESGDYEAYDGMTKLDTALKQKEGDGISNRIFYLSIPQDALLKVSRYMAANAQSKKGWNRVIIEKPFGSNSQTSAVLTDGLLSHFSEDQIYRIDHLFGKELVENLTVLRFSNLVFEPLWCRTYIRNVQITVSEDWGVQGEGKYFDTHGVIRDIVQTHILQMIAMFAMEPPVSLNGEDIRAEKVKVLRSMRKLSLQDVVLGQYKASVSKDGKSKIVGYLDEPGVSSDSLTPTFVAAVFYIDNTRWDGVPFLVKAGLGMIKNRVEIRIQFRHVPGNLYRERFGKNVDLTTNELVIQIQPKESILLKINNKVPGLGLQLDSSELNLFYRDKYKGVIPDSYEHLILDVINGDNHLFIRSDELQASWDLLTPLLEDIETNKVAPELYQFGGRGPVGAYYLGAKHGVRWTDD